MKIPASLFLLLFIFPEGKIYSQPRTNLDIFYSLIDSSVSEFINSIPQANDSVDLQLTLGTSYSVFGNKIRAGLYSSGKYITENKNAVSINYILDDAGVAYGEVYRDGLFGDFYVPRTLHIRGNYLFTKKSSLYNEFNFTYNDSIRYDEVSTVENESYPFTKGNLPSEPFLSSLFEPIVALGTAALAVILFFTIRSK